MQSVVERVDPRITFWLCLLATVACTPFLISHLLDNNWFMVAITASLDLLLLAIVWECWKTKHTPARGLIAATVLGAVVVFLAGIHLEMAGVLWAYPYIGFAYYFLGHRTANWIISIFCPAVAISAYSWAPPDQFPRLVVTLALTWMFCVVFAVNNHRQRVELARLAASDPLTGVGNRREMYAELGRAVHQLDRFGGRTSLILLDIDYFKSINDTYGHDAGDAVLIDLVDALSLRLRKTDRLFRIGGEEFVVFLPMVPLDDAVSLAECLRALVQEGILGGLRDVTISSGVAELAHGEDVVEWLKRADAALYRAKQLGRNRVVAA